MPRGLQLSQFGFCFYDLAPDEALHVHSDVPDTRYWSLQLYRMRWFSPYDISRITSLNHTQMHVGATAGCTWWSHTTIRALRTGSTPKAAEWAW